MPASAAHVSPFRCYRFPPAIISHTVWLYHRLALSHCDLEELLADRGIRVSYEAIRLFGQRVSLLGRRQSLDPALLRADRSRAHTNSVATDVVVSWISRLPLQLP